MANADEYIVEFAETRGDPPGYGDWQFLFPAMAVQVVQNSGANTSIAKIQLAATRWNDQRGVYYWDRVRVRTPGTLRRSTILFDGIVTQWTSHWSDKAEYCEFTAEDFRYLLQRCNVFAGQAIYPRSSYTEVEGVLTPTENTAILAGGRRCVFNANTQPNADAKPNKSGFPHTPDKPGKPGISESYTIPIFGYLHREAWNVRDMMVYVLAAAKEVIYQFWPGKMEDFNPNETVGLPTESTTKGTDWAAEPYNVVIEGLSFADAIEHLVSIIGWKWRLDVVVDGRDTKPQIVFYKPGVATKNKRSEDDPTILQYLYQPDNYDPDGRRHRTDNLRTLVSKNEPLIQSGNLSLDAGHVINKMVGLGAPIEQEITLELVPAWKDRDLDVDLLADALFMKPEFKADLDAHSDSYNHFTVFSRYNYEGDLFRNYLDVGRKWVANETGAYTGEVYDRGPARNFVGILNGETEDTHGYFLRQVLEALSSHDITGDSVKYVVEWSCDGGSTWRLLKKAVDPHKTEWGVYIDEPDLADIKLETSGDAPMFPAETFYADDPGWEKNYWTSLCYDLHQGHKFYSADGFRNPDDPEDERPLQWQTRMRLTATIVMDQRIGYVSEAPSSSPFPLVAFMDRSDRYPGSARTSSSKFAGLPEYPLPWWDTAGASESINTSSILDQEQRGMLNFLKQKRMSGSFSLPRIHGQVGRGDWARPRFMVGDCLTEIKGRGFTLPTGPGGEYVWIEQIEYLPEIGQTNLVIADLRQSAYFQPVSFQ